MSNKKIVTGFLVLVVVSCTFSAYAAEETGGGNILSGVFSTPSAEETFWFVKRSLYAFTSLDYSKEDMGFIVNNLSDLILLNPDAQGSEVQNGLGFILGLIQPLYVLSIAATAFYLIFVTGSPSGRAKAKSLMKDLVVGMIIISLSSLLLEALLNFSATATDAVLKQTDISVVTDNLQIVFGSPSDKSVTDVAVNSLLSESSMGLLGDSTAMPDYLMSHSCTLCLMHLMATFVEIELGYYTFLPFMLMIWGLGVYFFLRFAMVTLWLILFPLSILLYSFETTKSVGRNMLEQTIMWIFIQVFNAVIVVAIALCIIQSKPGYMTVPALPQWVSQPLASGLVQAVMGAIPVSAVGPAQDVTTLIAGKLSMPLVEFIPFVGCFVMLIAPLFIMRLFKGFLP